MARSIALGSFFSRNFRQVKTFATKAVVGSGTSSVLGLANHLRGFAIGTALAALPSMIWSFSQLWQMFTTTFYRVYTFDWNAPDDVLDRQVQSRWNAYGGQIGALLGKSIGFFACGVLPATSMFAFDEKLALYVGERVGEEILEELISEVAFVIRQGASNIATQGFYHTYKNVRRWLKQDSNPLIDRILGPEKARQIKETWGEQESQPFVIANEIEEIVETIPSSFWRQFTEELIEEAIEGCFEIGYVMALSMDQYYIDRKNFQTQNTKIVEIKPNRQNDRERIIIAGNESDVKSEITSIVAHHQLIENRDVGQIVGSDIDDLLRGRSLSLRLKFTLQGLKEPPYGLDPRVTITVPAIDRTKIDWDRMRLALGGANGYTWGKYKGRAVVSGSGGKEGITVYASTAGGAEQRLEALIALTDAEFDAFNITEEVQNKGKRAINPKLQKEPRLIYPAYVTVLNREKLIDVDEGRASYSGNHRYKHVKFPLWMNEAPPDFQEDLNEVLQRSN